MNLQSSINEVNKRKSMEKNQYNLQEDVLKAAGILSFKTEEIPVNNNQS